MEKLFMSAGSVVAIVLCLVGIAKLPFKQFKTKYPKSYRAIFTSMSFLFAIGLCVLDELYVLSGKLLSVDFVLLLVTVLAGVFCGYGGVYEGLGLKDLMKKLGENLKKVKELSTDKKIAKLEKKVQKVNNVISLLEAKKNQMNEV